MNIIKTADTSRTVKKNFFSKRVYLFEKIYLVEQFGIFALVFCQNCEGKADIFIVHKTTDRSKALQMFDDYTVSLSYT